MKDQINTIREALTAALSDDQPYIEACKQALDAVDQIEAMVGEQKPICWAESDGEGGILWDQDSCFSNDPAWFDSPMPLYAAPVAQQPQAEEATSAGLEASISILSQLVDEQRQLLAEVDAVFGVDAHGIVLDDGDSALIDRVRAHLAATSEAKQPQAEPDMRKVCEALGFDPTNHHNAAKCPYCRGQQPQADLLAAAKEFCRKVEAGEARSTKSYAAFKSAIEQIEKQPQAEAVPSGVVRDADVEAAAKKMAEIFDYPWDFMPEKGRNTMRENVRAVLDAAIAQQKGASHE